MAIEMLQNIAKGSITDVKKSPMDIFKKSEELKQGIYILNRNDVAGVVLSKELYEHLLNQIEELEDRTVEAEAARRITLHDSIEQPKTYSLEDMRIDLSTTEYDDNDGWE